MLAALINTGSWLPPLVRGDLEATSESMLPESALPCCEDGGIDLDNLVLERSCTQVITFLVVCHYLIMLYSRIYMNFT